jgi:DNA-directed RNA polymerase subunit F
MRQAFLDFDAGRSEVAIRLILWAQKRSPVCRSHNFAAIAQKYLKTPPNDRVFRCFFHLIQITAEMFPGIFAEIVPSIIGFLPRCHELHVYCVFDSMMSACAQPTNGGRVFCDILREHHFVEKLVTTIRVCNDEAAAQQYDGPVLGLYRLLLGCCLTGDLARDCVGASIVPMLLDSLPRFAADQPAARAVQAMQWRVLIGVLRVERLPELRRAVPRARDAVTTERPEAVRENDTEALNFLTKFFAIDPDTVREASDDENELLVLRTGQWFERFPGHGIALVAICHFMEIAVQIAELRPFVIAGFFPLVVRAAGQENRVPRAVAIAFAKAVQRIRRANVAVDEEIARDPDFKEMLRTSVRQYERFEYRTYADDEEEDESDGDQ